MGNRIGPLLFAAALLAAGPACGGGGTRQRADGRRVPAMLRHEFIMPGLGGDFRIVVYCSDEQAARLAERVAFAQLADLERIFDEGRPDSEVSLLHANAGLGAVRTSTELYFLLRQGIRLYERSDGAVDVTAGAYAALWRAAAAEGRMPTDQELAQADTLVGFEKLRLDPIDRTAHLTVEGMRLDLAALLRGYVCDRLLAALKRAGFRAALVDGGGRIALGDAPPGTKGWWIEVQNAGRRSKERRVQLARRAIASSGQVGDVVVIDGRPYSRLMNPQTGIGADNLAAATVVARRGWQADALARAAAVLGEEQGRQLVESVRAARVSFHRPRGVPAQAEPAPPADARPAATPPTDAASPQPPASGTGGEPAVDSSHVDDVAVPAPPDDGEDADSPDME